MRKNIVILTMSLNIGGAETHIFELACALSQRGNHVTVFSAGGVYADKLSEKGIQHITAPLNKKDPVSLIRSYRAVSSFVKKNRPCIIHSHTRISNFTARLISKKYNIPFVSTVHFSFSTRFFQKLLTNWGDRSLAVSEDLKEYTTREYGFDRDKITVTVNGINLNTFSKKRLPEFKAELGIEENSKVILCVSRLDRVACEHVERVLKISEKIYADTPNCNIVIVGGGTRFKKLSELAADINSRTKKDFIIFTGPQTDIYRYYNISDLFIGISRSALEAMACKVPVILLGNDGYLGLYSEKTHDACIDTNFTCRSFPYPDDSEITALATDILKDPEKYIDNVENAYRIVRDRYSVKRMAEDALSSYAEAERDTRPYDMILCGYYGRHNLGDDILLEQITGNIKKECGAVHNVLLTSAPENIPANIDVAIHRFNIFKICRYMKKSKLFLLGGGSILQDVTSSRSIYYYLFVSNLAKNMGCKLMLYSNGIGPIYKKRHITESVKLLKKADAITVRDSKSLEYLRYIGVDSDNIQVTADEVFTIDPEAIPQNVLPHDKKYICINLRSISTTESFLNNIAAAVSDIAKEYSLVPVLLPMHYSQDMPALVKLDAKLECEHLLISKQLSHSETLAMLKRCDIAIIERLHAVIFSCIFGTPFIAINYDPKVQSLCKDLDMEGNIIDINNFDIQKLENVIRKTVINANDISENLKQKAVKKRELAKNNAAVAAALFE